MWAIGIMMCELLKYTNMQPQEKQNKKVISTSEFQVLHSDHCFPLSPKNVVWQDDGFPCTKGDLLDSIFDLIGTPDANDIKFISD